MELLEVGFGLDANTLYPELRDRSKRFVYIERKADPMLAEKLLARKLVGVASYPEERRTYPQGTVAAHVLRFAGVDNNGLAGLELPTGGRVGDDRAAVNDECLLTHLKPPGAARNRRRFCASVMPGFTG